MGKQDALVQETQFTSLAACTGLVLGKRKQRSWNRGTVRLVSAAPGASPVLAGGMSGLRGCPEPSHTFCPALWVGMRWEGAPDLAQGTHLAWPWSRQAMPGLTGTAAGARPGGY